MLGAKQKQTEQSESQAYIQKALAAWKDAQNYFDNVSDPDLIEVAVYDMQAAERRYAYMLKCAKRGQNMGGVEKDTADKTQEAMEGQDQTKRIDKHAIRQRISRLSGGPHEKQGAEP